MISRYFGYALVGVLIALFSPDTNAGSMCASASGGTGLSSAPSFSSFAVDGRHQRFDRQLRKGKFAYAKRNERGEKIKYCVMVDGEPKRVSRSRLEAFHGRSVTEFALSLVDCNQPEQFALAQVQDRSTIPDILYYLAAHYQVPLVKLSPEERLAQQQKDQKTPELDHAVAAAQ